MIRLSQIPLSITKNGVTAESYFVACSFLIITHLFFCLVLPAVILNIYGCVLIAAIVALYFIWRNNPDFTIGEEDYRQFFYETRPFPRNKQGPTIHKLAVIALFVMGLQREAGLMDPRYKYDNKPAWGIIAQCSLISFLLTQVNTNGFKSILETSVNTQNISFMEAWLMTANVSFATFGFFLIIGAVPLWIYYQMQVMEGYWDWQEKQTGQL